MIVCVDVDYRETAVVTACVGFDAWTDATSAHELVVRSSEPAAAYAPGRFFERELPYLRSALDQFARDLSGVRAASSVHAPSTERAIDVVVIDGYVWLAPGVPGLCDVPGFSVMASSSSSVRRQPPRPAGPCRRTPGGTAATPAGVPQQVAQASQPGRTSPVS